MANIYHWLTGSQTDLFSDIYLTASYGAQAVTGSSRYGSGSAWEIGTSTSSRSTLYSGYNVSGPDALPNLGTGDITVAFWWKPNSSTFNGSGQRHLFQYSPGAALEVYHNASLSSDTESDYNLIAQYRYGDGSTSHSRTYRLNLSQVDGEYPWIKIYASRINGVFYFNLYNADGDDLTDKDGGATTWSESGYSNQIYNASGSSPHIRIGGDFAYGQTAGGIYDDIFLTLDHGILAGDLELDSDGYAKIDPVVNSFSTSDTSVANSGDAATLSWNTDFNTSTQLLKYVGGLLSDTETVTGSSKQVTVTETVSYKLRTTNIYGSVDSETVEIQLSNGGNSMPVTPVGNNNVSGSLVLQKVHLAATGSNEGVADVLVASHPTSGSYEVLNTVIADMYFEQVSADNALSGALMTTINNEVASIDLRVSNDEDLLASEVASIDTRISNEISATDSEVTSLDARVSAEISATDSEVASLSLRVSNDEDLLASEVASIDTRISNEISATDSEVTSLDARVSAEISATDSEVASLSLRVSNDEDLLASEVASIDTRISNEISATDSEVTSLDARVSAEISATDSEVASLSLRVSNDEDLLASEVASIDTRISNEISATDSEVTSLDARVSAEISATDSEVTSLDARVSAEISATDSEVTSLDARVSATETGLANFQWDAASSVATIGGASGVELIFVEEGDNVYLMVESAS